jgi:hypothetical protein
MLLLNEDPPGSHVDVHGALKTMVSQGLLADVAVFPFAARMSAGLPADELGREILAECERFDPTQVLFSHSAGMRLDPEVVVALRGSAGQPALGYWEADWYAPLSKPLPVEVGLLAGACDVSFLCGEGYVSRAVTRAGCPRVEYVPLLADEAFGSHAADALPSFDFDVVMVGNLHTRRNPFVTMRGAIERRSLAALFAKRLGTRFAVFGNGWTGPSAMGPIPFLQQVDVYRRSAIVLGNNDLHAAYYFSNRLPIAMMSSRPVIHGFERGIDKVVPGELPVSWFSSVRDSWECYQRVSDAPPSLDALDSSRAFAVERLSTRGGLIYMSALLSAIRGARLGAAVEERVANPWGIDLAGRRRS